MLTSVLPTGNKHKGDAVETAECPASPLGDTRRVSLVAVLVVPFPGLPVQWSILLIGLVPAAAVAEHVVHSGRAVTA